MPNHKMCINDSMPTSSQPGGMSTPPMQQPASQAASKRPNKPSMNLGLGSFSARQVSSPLSFADPSSGQPSTSSPDSSSARTPRASSVSSLSKSGGRQDDPFASSFASSSSSSSSLQDRPDYFQEKPEVTRAAPMTVDAAPTPGPSQVGKDHPWARLFQNGGSSQQVPATPGEGKTPGGMLGVSHMGQPLADQLNPSSTSFSSYFGAGLNGTKPKGQPLPLKDPRPSSSGSSGSVSGGHGPSAPIFSSVPITSSLSLPIPPKKSGAGVSADLKRFQSIESHTMARCLSNEFSSDKGKVTTSTLIIDIRPSTSFVSGRIKSSINVCAPSTLLKRPGVTIQRLEDDMLQSPEDRQQFSRWRQGPSKGSTDQVRAMSDSNGVDQIVVLDTDTANIGDAGRSASGGGGACLVGLLRKFDAAGFNGTLMWLVGGYASFEQYAQANKMSHLIEQGQTQASGSGDPNDSSQARVPTLSGGRPSFRGRLQMTGNLTRSPSSQSAPSPSLVQCGLPMEAFTNRTTTAQSPNKSTTHPGGNEPQGAAKVSSSSNAACNPFFDNIRQNRELQHGITERIPLEIGNLSVNEKEALPPFLRRMVDTDGAPRAETLAQGFFDIEKAEQNRLMATMHQHSSESTGDPRTAANPTGRFEQLKASPPALSLSAPHATSQDSASQLSSSYCRVSSNPSASFSASSFPFSIAAAIERGDQNRYNNIWTYEHSRVKVASDRPASAAFSNAEVDPSSKSDYLNGSFVEPLREFGCYRRYIATQAPLPSTFETFWRAVWQQNSRTIAMLTREYESGRVQSHNYWSEPSYGSSIRLRVLEERELDARGLPCNKPGSALTNTSSNEGGGFFAEVARESDTVNKVAVMILRKIELGYNGSDEKPRIVNHLQFIGWPDYSIPSDPEALLVFMDLASRFQQEAHLELSDGRTTATHGIEWSKQSATGPLMLHCSAGVGRTGTYAVIDSVLDVLRRERARRKSAAPYDVWDNGDTSSGLGYGDRGTSASEAQDVEMHPADEVPHSAPMPKASALRPWPRQLDNVTSDSNAELSKSASPNGFAFSSASSGNDFMRSTRRSLKRGLSPSAHMDLDWAAKGNTSERTASDASHDEFFTSPPPMRRNRSSSSDVALSTTSSSDTTDSDLLPSDGDSLSTRSRSSTSSSLPFNGWSHLGIHQPDGMDTPSRAMDGMSLGLGTASPAASLSNSTLASARHSPTPASTSHGISDTGNFDLDNYPRSTDGGWQSHSSDSTSVQRRRGSSAKQMRSSESTTSPQVAAATASHAASSSIVRNMNKDSISTRSSSLSPPYAASSFGDVDLVRRATDVAREQRMSSVQTQRQFVFCYAAVLKGVLRETERDGG
ncbi:unnamed protein product [Sympodiomycopsis kandeliae]